MSTSLADRVFRRLRDDLLDKRWKVGERLPSERAIAAEFGVNRGTVRTAVGRLVELGLVTVRRGDGIRAAESREAAGLDLMTHMMEVSQKAELPISLVEDFLELRRMLTPEAVALACERATDAHIAELSRIAAEQATRLDNPKAFERGDSEFIRATLRATGNLSLELLFNTIASFYRTRPEIAQALLLEPTTALANYHRITAIIAQRDPERARTDVREALEIIDAAAVRRLKEHVEPAPVDEAKER